MKQPEIIKRLTKTWQNHYLAHAYLFYGAKGVGKLETAEWLAQTLFCSNPQIDGACRKCSNCMRIVEHEFSDVQYIEPDGATLKIEQIRQLKDNVSYSSLENEKKVYIIDGVEKMTTGASNALLKFLEEPAGNVYFILLTSQKDMVLPTIQSRCQLVNFPNLSIETLDNELKEMISQDTFRQVLIHLTQDKVEIEMLLATEEFQQFYHELTRWILLLLSKDSQAFIMVQTKLLPFLSNKDFANYGLDILSIYLRDGLLVAAGYNEHVLLKKQLDELQKIKIDCEMVLNRVVLAKKHLNSFVSAALCYEEICLTIL